MRCCRASVGTLLRVKKKSNPPEKSHERTLARFQTLSPGRSPLLLRLPVGCGCAISTRLEAFGGGHHGLGACLTQLARRFGHIVTRAVRTPSTLRKLLSPSASIDQPVHRNNGPPQARYPRPAVSSRVLGRRRRRGKLLAPAADAREAVTLTLFACLGSC